VRPAKEKNGRFEIGGWKLPGGSKTGGTAGGLV
jgi:hypothetical protein